MRRVVLAFASTVTAIVLLLGLKAQLATPLDSPPLVVDGGASASSGVPSSNAKPSAGSKPKPSTGPVTVTGDSVSTPYGPVQVRVTVAGGKITAVNTLSYPSGDSHSQQIGAYAVPRLTQEALAAGNANIDMVSGATYTSQGYVQSLQSALNQVG